MKLNISLQKIFDILGEVKSIKSSISIDNGNVEIKDLIRVTPEELVFINKFNVEEKIIGGPLQDSNTIDLSKLKKFVGEIHPHIVRLNHLGINYSCRNIENEMNQYKDLLTGSHFKVFEEDSGSVNNRWFFIGDASEWQEPMFEIVLTQSVKQIFNKWIPHFQIDVDTDLSFEEIKEITDKVFGQHFIVWKMDIPNYGIPMAMGLLGDVSGTKIYLGIGTNLRKTEIHRKNLLKEY